MVAGRPFYPRFPQDFIMAVRGWDLEYVGAYSLIVDHLNERDRHLPDDVKFMAGLLNCSPQRWRKIRQFLLEHGKIIITDDGYLTNPRFERDKAERLKKRGDAIEHGHAGGMISRAKRAGQTELPLGEQSTKHPKELQKIGQNFRDSFASDSSVSKQKPNKINAAAQPPPQAPCARVRDQSLEKDSSQPSVHARTPAREEPASLLDRHYAAVCDASGFCPSAPAQIELAKGIVAEWIRDGIDFERTVLPTIRLETARLTEPTRTLGRFRRAVALAHTKAKSQPSIPRSTAPSAEPILEPADEDPMFQPVRKALLGALGRTIYPALLNDVRFQDVGPCQGDKRPVRLVGPSHSTERLLHGANAATLRTIARANGFTDVWS